MPRKSANNAELWKRRCSMFEEWCAGTSVLELARKYKLDREAARSDINATIALLKNYDGLEQIGLLRQRVIAQYWREVEVAYDAEAACLKGLDSQAVLKTGEIVKVKLVDPRAAGQYQANRIKALQSIQRMMRLEDSAPSDESEKSGKTWAELIKLAQKNKKLTDGN